MKKIAILAVMLALVTPVMAATSVTIDACSVGTTGNVAIIYNATGGDVSGFGLNITIDNSKNLTAIGGYHIGESNSTSKGYGIFPGTIDINDTTGNVDSYGNPVAPSSDPCALGGLGTGGITIEIGALYTTGNAPGRAGTLCTVMVSGDCNLTVALNQRRGGVVDVNYLDATTPGLPRTRHIHKVTTCTVPNVVGMSNAAAAAAITAAGLVPNGSPVLSCVTLNQVLNQNPGPSQQTCGSTVNYDYSRYETTMPNILGMTAADANAAITAAGLVVSGITWNTSSTVDINTVMSQNPTYGTILSCDPHSPSYELSSGCYPKGKGDYSTWRVQASPNFKTHCWCYTRQCHGDTDNATGGTSKSGYYYVGSADLGVLLSNWQILDPPFGSGTPAAGRCADFAHDLGGTSKSGYYRVGSTDLGVLLSNWQILEPPFGSGMSADCLNVP